MEIDRELVVRAKRGETVAQEELVAQLEPMVFRLASRFFRSREDVEDLSQETFIRFRPGSSRRQRSGLGFQGDDQRLLRSPKEVAPRKAGL